MRFLGGGVGHVVTREAVDKFEKIVHETLRLEEEITGDDDIEMIDPREMELHENEEEEEEEEDQSADSDSDSDSDSKSDGLEYLDEPDKQYAEEEAYGYPEA